MQGSLAILIKISLIFLTGICIAFPDEIKKFPNLEHGVHVVSTEAIPIWIGQCEKSTHLDLSYNDLKSILDEIGLLTKLGYFYLSNNNLEDISHELAKLVALRRLDLSRNKLKDVSLNWIGQLAKLTRLDLPDNEIAVLPLFIEGLVMLEHTCKILLETIFVSRTVKFNLDATDVNGKCGNVDVDVRHTILTVIQSLHWYFLSCSWCKLTETTAWRIRFQ